MRLGIAGTGKIVTEALYALEPLKQIEVKSIFARPHSLEKGKTLAAKHSVPAVYTDYDEFLSDPDIDTVYIGLVNSAHFEYAKRALEKYKHVILEKPFTQSYDEAVELMDLAARKNRFIFEAITVLHNEVIEKMRAGMHKLGRIRVMLANYSQYSSRYDSYLEGKIEPCFDPAHHGGALWDLNVYNIHYAAALLGTAKRASYFPNKGFNGVDTSGTLVLEYDGFNAVCTAAKDSDSPCFVIVQGEKGYMKIDGKPNVAPNLTIVYQDESAKEPERDSAGAIVRSTVEEQFVPPKPHHRMTGEFMDFAQIIDIKDSARASELSAQSLEVMKILDFFKI